MFLESNLHAHFGWVSTFCFALIMSVETSAQTDLKPPVAQKIPKVDTINGEVMADNYFWLRDKSNPEVTKYLEEENAYTKAVLKPTEELQEKLYKEILGRIRETDLTVPAKEQDYYYYSRTEEGKQYPIFCRKKGTLDGPEEVMLDQNEMAKGHDYFSLAGYSLSADHQLIAFAVDTTGAERYLVQIKDLKTGTTLSDRIANTGGNLEWANDNKTLFYTTRDEANRPDKLWRHTLGTDQQADQLLYEEKDDRFFMGIDKTKSKSFLVLQIGSNTTSEMRILEADQPMGEFRIVEARREEIEYSLTHHGDKFYIVTNDQAKNFKVMEVSVADPRKENWKEMIPHRDDVKIDFADAFAHHLVVAQRQNGLQQIQIWNLLTGESHMVEFPEPVYSFDYSRNPEYNTDKVRFIYESLTTPKSVYDYDMNTKSRELKKEYEVLGGYDRTQYQSERLFATAFDGTKVPISLVYRKGFKKDGSNPLYLYGYGAYGYSMDPYFSSNRITLLDRGFAFAFAHVRGGQEMGRYWYDQGKLMHKKNTFTDFIACAEHLIKEKYTSKDKLVISGASAGGLLVGAAANMRPDLFKIVIADVPFVDLINTMLDESIPLTVIEYEEWGNPHEKGFFDYMKSYSPYDNVAAKAYPNILITTSLNDPRVAYWEPAKWCAKLRSMKTDTNRLLLKTNMEAGHGGASGRYERLKEIAFEYSFIFDVLGIRQ